MLPVLDAGRLGEATCTCMHPAYVREHGDGRRETKPEWGARAGHGEGEPPGAVENKGIQKVERFMPMNETIRDKTHALGLLIYM